MPIVAGRVSVIIPTYNRAGPLEQAVSSCLTQTYGDIEVLIVDDGSTDDTSHHVEQLMRADWLGKQIHYWRTENSGQAAARQFGTERSRGEFVQYLDSDDLLQPQKFELQVAALQASGADAVCCSCFGRKGLLKDGWENATRIGVRAGTVAEYVRAMCSKDNFPMSCDAPLWRRSYLAGQPGWPIDLVCSEDWAYYTGLLVRAREVVFVDEDLFWACDHDGARASATKRREAGNLRKMASSAQAIRRVERCVREAGYFDREVQAGLLGISKGVYSLLLESGDSTEIRGFEEYVRELGSDPQVFSIISCIGWFRRLFGINLTRWALRQYLGKL